MMVDNSRLTGASHQAKPSYFIVVLLCIHLTICCLVLAKNVRNSATSNRLVSSDSVHYLDIARDFASGDFSMAYVKERPHRQPLYPALLAVAMKIGNGNRFFLGMVNVIIASISILCIYLFVLALFGQRLAAAVTALALAANPFIDRQITARLLTEPLHLFLTICAIFTFLRYAQRKDCRWLYACSVLVGLDYLTRPNGLIMAGAAIGTMALSDLLTNFAQQRGGGSLFPYFVRSAGSYVVAIGVFLLVSTPSWLPRLIFYGKPFHHGYLENYMWVDTYKEGHVGESYASYSWRDYFAHHHIRDVVERLLHGVRNVYFRIPILMERVPLLFLLGIGGALIALRVPAREYRFLCLFLVLQMQPLVWTNLSNPTARVPYGSMLPFELFLAAFLLARLFEQPKTRAWLAPISQWA